jgi:predicted nucleic acid-binding protein
VISDEETASRIRLTNDHDVDGVLIVDALARDGSISIGTDVSGVVAGVIYCSIVGFMVVSGW